jgi:hypothetical protein
MAAYDLTATSVPCGSVDYILTNPTSATPVNPAVIAIDPRFAAVQFADPVHKYDAVELTLNRRMANNWTLITSYRWSRLHGNFEGFYREDNGQSDPHLVVMRFPDQRSDIHVHRHSAGYPGDIRFLNRTILPLIARTRGRSSATTRSREDFNLASASTCRPRRSPRSIERTRTTLTAARFPMGRAVQASRRSTGSRPEHRSESADFQAACSRRITGT